MEMKKEINQTLLHPYDKEAQTQEDLVQII